MKKKKKTFKTLCFLIFFLTIFAAIYFSSDKIVIEYASKYFSSVISAASYHAIDFIVSDEYDYDELVNVKTDNDGNISMVVTDSYKANEMAANVAENAYEYLSGEIVQGVDVPIGAFTGIRLLSGFGVKVKMKVISVSSVKCVFISDFTQAGINQTRHSLYLNIHCVVNLVTKTATKEIKDEISVLMFDNLIVGKVPQVIVNPITIGKGGVNI